MAIKKLYKCYMPSMNYLTVKGRTCTFVEGRYLTDHPDEVKELDQMVADKSNPHIYVDENEKEVDTTLQERIKEAHQEATLRILKEEAERKAALEAAGTQPGQTAAQTAQVNQGAGATMSPASLLNVTTSAGLSALSSLSNSK